MDPLSVAASAAGLMSLCIGIVHVVGNYYTSAKNAPTDIQGLRSELAYLSTILERLEYVLRSDSIRCNSVSFDTSSVLITALNSCEKQIREVSSKLERRKGSNASRMLERLKWPFSEKEVQKLLEVLRRYSLTFQFSLTVEGW
jgi:ankyrin repeat domain-containing protein 50